MSFNYSNLSRNSMHNMMPLMENMTNGSSNAFMSQLAAAVTAAAAAGSTQSSSTSSLITSPASTISRTSKAPPPPSFNDSPLEFKTSSNSASKLKINCNEKQVSHNSACENNNQQQQLGAVPMDLENDLETYSDNDNPTLNCIFDTSGTINNVKRHLPGGCPGGDKNLSTERVSPNTVAAMTAAAANEKTPQLMMGNEMFLNSMLGMTTPHQSFMMMPPGMMMDPSTAAMAAMQMQQFPLIHSTAAAQLTAAAVAAANVSGTTSNEVNHTNSENAQSVNTAGAIGPVKELITCKSCTLFPPNPNAPPPTIRERPPGCRTVFVGGLPENITEEIIREIFESCGEITTLRLSKKNFCHIRFVFQASVDSAIYLSGYRIRIMNNEPTNCGRLHVDYAQARDDQYEWECKQRQLQREQRHRERMERDRLRSVSPPPIVHYTEHEAALTAESLKNNDSFLKAVQTLIVWLERGDCSKKNANIFYSMIQSTNAHVRRLNNDKFQFEEELRRAREHYRKQMLNMSQQFTQIEKVFNAASHKKVWDHFTKAQRKNIDQWKKLAMELRSVQIDDDEMDMSDDDRDYRSTNSKRSRFDNESLKEENDSLRCQVEAYKNEMNLVKTDNKSDNDLREKQIKVLQETIRNMQTQLLETKYKEKSDANKIEELERKLKEAGVKQLLLKTKIVEVNARHSRDKDRDVAAGLIPATSKTSEGNEENEMSLAVVNQLKYEDQGVVVVDTDDEDCVEKKAAATTGKLDVNFAEKKPTNKKNNDEYQNEANKPFIQEDEKVPIALVEAKIIGLVSTLLVVHPHGASSSYIHSYLQKNMPTNLGTVQHLEEIMAKYSNVFTEENKDNNERKWKFCGFSSTTS